MYDQHSIEVPVITKRREGTSNAWGSEGFFFLKIRQFCEETGYVIKRLKELSNVLNR